MGTVVSHLTWGREIPCCSPGNAGESSLGAPALTAPVFAARSSWGSQALALSHAAKFPESEAAQGEILGSLNSIWYLRDSGRKKTNPKQQRSKNLELQSKPRADWRRFKLKNRHFLHCRRLDLSKSRAIGPGFVWVWVPRLPLKSPINAVCDSRSRTQTPKSFLIVLQEPTPCRTKPGALPEHPSRAPARPRAADPGRNGAG